MTLLLNWLKMCREQNHVLFCLSVSSLFTLTAIIGHMVPDTLPFYSILMLLALTPGACLLLPLGNCSNWFNVNLQKDKTTWTPFPSSAPHPRHLEWRPFAFITCNSRCQVTCTRIGENEKIWFFVWFQWLSELTLILIVRNNITEALVFDVSMVCIDSCVCPSLVRWICSN